MLKLYFLEIRNRIGLIVLVWFSLFFVCYLYKEILLFILIKPFIKVYFKVDPYFIATNLTEIFSSYILISFFISNQLTFFFSIYQVLIFFYPALYNSEYKKLRSLFLICFFLWLLNIFFLNNFLFSYVFRFFLSFQSISYNDVVDLHFEMRLIEYLRFYKRLFYFSALSFQIFLFIFIFINNLKNKVKFLRSYRKIFFFMFFLMSTFISPPDVFSQIWIGFLFSFIFECLIILVFLLKNLDSKSYVRRL